jgi:hypothetical protein
LYLSIKGKKQEKITFGPRKADLSRDRIPTGIYMLQNELCVCEDPQRAALIDIQLTSPTIIKFTDSNKIIRTGGSRKEIAAAYSPDKDSFPAFMIAEFFQSGYKTELANFIKQPSGNYRIQSDTHRNYYLTLLVNKQTNKTNIRWEKNVDHEFVIHDKSVLSNNVDVMHVHRCRDTIMNDGTYYTMQTSGDVVYKAREYYWMVNHYMWEIVELPPGEVNIKLISDEQSDLYLSVSGDVVEVSPVPYNWVIFGAKIKDPKTGKYIQVDSTGVVTGANGTELL